MKIFRTSSLLFLFILLLIFTACEKDKPTNYLNLYSLPADTGGVHMPIGLGSTDSPYGYYMYLPSGYGELEELVYPILIFLHGSGEKGNSETNIANLDKVLRNGPPDMIEKGNWKPKHPMLVASPQCHDGGWNADKLNEFILYLIENYDVNTRCIYLTGLSMGGFGTFSYLGKYGDDALFAAAVPICGGGNVNQAKNFENIPLWAFHGEADKTVLTQKSIDMVDAINAIDPKFEAKLTLFPGVGHNSWDYTYESTGMGKENPVYDPFDQDIYTWMFEYQRYDIDSLMNK